MEIITGPFRAAQGRWSRFGPMVVDVCRSDFLLGISLEGLRRVDGFAKRWTWKSGLESMMLITAVSHERS